MPLSRHSRQPHAPARTHSRAHSRTLLSTGVFTIALLSSFSIASAQSTMQTSPAANPAANLALVAGQPLPVSRITLYRSGVASMERRGTVSGDASVQLTFASSQINDILKSMIVLDMGGGTVRSVEYASEEGLDRRLASFGLNIASKPNTAQLLDQLRGSKVRIVMVDGSLEGTVLSVENRRTVVAGRESTTVHDLPWVSLVTREGVRSANLANATGFDILDTELAAELNKALAAIAEMRSEQRKAVTIAFEGKGDRPVMAAYVQESPVWKTSYRLALSDDDSKPMLQGWAIVENTSEEDWIDVSLSLASGQPSAFRMNLYTPLFTTRPELAVPVPLTTIARAFEGGSSMLYQQAPSAVAMTAPGSPAPAASMKAGSFQGRGEGGAGQSPFAVSESMMANDADVSAGFGSTQAAATTMQTGDVFFFQLDKPVTVQRKRSAMLPIVSQAIEGKRVSIITSDQTSGFAMRGVRMQNSAGTQLVAGPVAVYDANVYAGDAQLNDLGQSQHALLGFATDTDVRVLRSDEATTTSRTLRIVNGVLEIRMQTRVSSTYTIDNSDAKKGRTMIVEVAKLTGGSLAAPAKALEVTDNVLRFEVPIAPGTEGKPSSTPFRVEQERTDFSSVGIIDSDPDSIIAIFGDATLSPAMQQAFERIRTIRSAVNAAEQREQLLVQERSEITSEQDRIRQNLASLDRTSDLAQRLTRKLSDQETRLDAITIEVTKARADARRSRDELTAFVANLNID